MKLNLGSLLVDTKVVQIDEASYYEMSPMGNATDMDAIEATWKETNISGKRVSIISGKETHRKKKLKMVMSK
jgi:hypothetical protein